MWGKCVISAIFWKNEQTKNKTKTLKAIIEKNELHLNMVKHVIRQQYKKCKNILLH